MMNAFLSVHVIMENWSPGKKRTFNQAKANQNPAQRKTAANGWIGRADH